MEAGLGRERGRDLGATVVIAGDAFAEVVGLNQAGRGGAEICAGEFLVLSAGLLSEVFPRNSPNRFHPSPLRSRPSWR